MKTPSDAWEHIHRKIDRDAAGFANPMRHWLSMPRWYRKAASWILASEVAGMPCSLRSKGVTRLASTSPQKP